MRTLDLRPPSSDRTQPGSLFAESTGRKILVVVFLFLVAVQGAYLMWIGNGVGKLCDPFSEANALRAAEAYLNDGLTSHHGLPRQAYGHRFPTEGFLAYPPEHCPNLDTWAYTHYPEGPDVLLTLVGRVVGLENLPVLRLFPLGLSLLATAVFFRTLAWVFGADRAALVAGACVLLPMFNTSMPGLHFEGYSWALFLLQMSLLMRIYWKWTSVPRWCWAALFLFGFVQGWLSFDQFFVVGLVAWPLWLLRRSEGGALSRTHLALPVILAFAGFGFAHVLHFLQVAGELGGLGAALAEFRTTAVERVNQAGVTVPQMLQRHLFSFLQTDSARVSYFRSLILGAYQYVRDFLRPQAVQFFPLLPLAVVLGVLAALFRRIEVNLPCPDNSRPLRLSFSWPNNRRVSWTLFAALFISVVWLLVMPAHSVGNHHLTVRHFFVFYFFLVLILVRSLRMCSRGEE